MLFDPIIECVYGWGQVMRLYDDHLEIGGTSYSLMDLVAVHPNYYHVMGIPSACLELCFKHKRVMLRGIAAIETAQRTASYLSAFCRLQTTETATPLASSVSASWPEETSKKKRQTDEDEALRHAMIQPQVQPTHSLEFTRVTDEHSLIEQKKTPVPEKPRWQWPGYEWRQRRRKRIRAEQERREHGFDVEQLRQLLQAEVLPQVYVPTRLLIGECAHYCTNATLSEELLAGTKQSNYRVKDQGMLILTDRRMIYIGRRRQLVLDYSRLLHASRLPGAVAIVSENWVQRELFEVRFPLECTMYLDAILLRYRKRAIHERPYAKVRQLYPSTKTRSYDIQTSAHDTQSEALAQWHSSDPTSK